MSKQFINIHNRVIDQQIINKNRRASRYKTYLKKCKQNFKLNERLLPHKAADRADVHPLHTGESYYYQSHFGKINLFYMVYFSIQ